MSAAAGAVAAVIASNSPNNLNPGLFNSWIGVVILLLLAVSTIVVLVKILQIKMLEAKSK